MLSYIQILFLLVGEVTCEDTYIGFKGGSRVSIAVMISIIFVVSIFPRGREWILWKSEIELEINTSWAGFLLFCSTKFLNIWTSTHK